MIKSPKSIKNVGLLFVMVLFLTGCVKVQEYIYEEDTFKRVEEKESINQAGEKKEEWIGSFLEGDKFVRQCPICQRKYSDSLKRCPYDGAKLDKINE